MLCPSLGRAEHCEEGTGVEPLVRSAEAAQRTVSLSLWPNQRSSMRTSKSGTAAGTAAVARNRTLKNRCNVSMLFLNKTTVSF